MQLNLKPRKRTVYLKKSLNFPRQHEDFDYNTKHMKAKCNYWFNDINIFHVCSFYQLVRVGGIKYSES